MAVDPAQVKAAVRALYLYIASTKKEEKDSEKKLSLFAEDLEISVQIALKKTPTQQRNKPFQILLPHSLYPEDGAEICLFTKDPQRQYKDLVAELPFKGITKVIGVEKLRKKYGRFQDRRDLLATYQLFLADDRILPLLPALLGKSFFEKKRQPIAVNLRKKDLVKEFTQARDSTYLYLTTGPCCAFRIGRSSFTEVQVVENILAGLGVVEKLPKKWKNIQAIYIKTPSSVAIPFYASLPLSQRLSQKKKKPAENESEDRSKNEGTAPNKAGKKRKQQVGVRKGKKKRK